MSKLQLPTVASTARWGPAAVGAALVTTLALGCVAHPPQSQHAAVGVRHLFLSPDGSDANSCTRASPCRSLGRAYRAARPGETVELTEGSYGNQSIDFDASKRSRRRILFRPAAGAHVALGELTVRGRHVELRRLTLAGWTTTESAADVTFRDVKSGFLFVHSSAGVSVLGGAIGPGNDFDSQIAMASPSARPPRNIRIDGVWFHDWRLTPGSDAHVECLQIGEVDGLTIANSRFTNCETHNVFISPWFGGAERNILLVNNFGGTVLRGYYGFRVAAGSADETCDHIVFNYNSATSPFELECGKVLHGVRLAANVGPYPASGCRRYIRYVHNVWAGARCGSTDRNAASGFVDSTRSDLHLRPGAVAIGRGDPRSYPARDIDRQKRPRGKRPDAGADER